MRPRQAKQMPRKKKEEAKKKDERKKQKNEAKPESEKGERREPGNKAEATETTAEGATVTTCRWSVPRETLRIRPRPELRESPY